MLSVLRYVEVVALGVWLGGIVLFSFIVAPALFQVLGSRHLAGDVVTVVLNRLYGLGYACGALYLLALFVEHWLTGEQGSRFWLAVQVGLVAALLLLTLYSDFFLGQRLAGLREQMKAAFGSVDETALDHPLRLAFNRYHRVSVALLTGTLAGVLALLGVALRSRR